VTPFERAREYWAVRLGCARGALVLPGLTVVPHPEERALFAFLSGESVVVMAPERLHEALFEVAQPGALVTPEGLGPFVPDGSRLIGPASVAYLEGELVQPDGVVKIESVWDPRLEELRRAVLPEEWRHANLQQAEPPLFGVEHQGHLGAAAGFERVQDRVAHIGVLSDPRSRERGFGRLVTQAVGARALELQILPQYQTLLANTGALRIGQQLGFAQFAVTLAARW
jgi:hypothetical protein